MAHAVLDLSVSGFNAQHVFSSSMFKAGWGKGGVALGRGRISKLGAIFSKTNGISRVLEKLLALIKCADLRKHMKMEYKRRVYLQC